MDPAALVQGVTRRARKYYHQLRTRGVSVYRNPTDQDLADIELRLKELQVPCFDFVVEPDEFRDFVHRAAFPAGYHGGVGGGVYYEKLLEHYVAWKFLFLDDAAYGSYVDVAACSSPWAMILRRNGIESFAIDLSVSAEYSSLAYYRQENATMTSFKDGDIGRASLQCAYEMFLGGDDVDLLSELSRILKPGGRAVISPLYMHTHPCYYQSAEYYGKSYGDTGAKAYVRRDCWGVPASRKYSPETLKSRVWDRAIAVGLQPKLFALRNKSEISPEIYLHFILVLEKTVDGINSHGGLSK